MGYTTDFSGRLTLDKPLTLARWNYLKQFSESRRMARNSNKAEKLNDPKRLAVGLPIGVEGGYYVGTADACGSQHNDASVTNGNGPPKGQPGLWCQWVPTDDGTGVEWDGYGNFLWFEWLEYLITHFYKVWGYTLNGDISWQGEGHGDIGTITVRDNVVTQHPGTIMLEPELVKPTMTLLDELGTLLTRYGQDQGTDGKGAFRDMLTDLMHVAQNQGLDFNERLKAARRVFKQE